MEAGNKGAQMGNGVSVGLNIDLPFEQFSNQYIDKEHNLNFEYFSAKSYVCQIFKGFCGSPVWEHFG